jgi:hypothetical protein
MTTRCVLKAISIFWVALVTVWLSPANSHSQESQIKTYKLDSGLYYTIQKGDTLWDLSEYFFDSPWVWPDLWQKNKEIPNPHWIYPGNRIRIFSREGMERISEASPSLEPAPHVEKERRPPYYLYPPIDSIGFVRKEPLLPWGVIFRVKEDKVIIGEGDLIYVRPVGKAAFRSGDRFTVFRTLETLRDQETRTPVGIQHYVVGVIQITDVEPKYSTATVVESFRHIEINDLLMPYKARSPKITLTESKKGINGKVLVSEENQYVFGDQAIVFIDKGRKDGIKVGQSYSIYYQDKECLDPKGKEEVLLSPVDFGKILILRTEEATATALVTMADKDIEPGAKLRTPPR